MEWAALSVHVRLALKRFEIDLTFDSSCNVTGIFGPSGAGKTSLLEVIAGLRRNATGKIRLGEEVWMDSAAGIFLEPERRRIGYVPQDALLFPHMNVKKNLLAGSARLPRSGHATDEILRDVSVALRLDAIMSAEVHQLSGGERQRVALGRALCSHPRLLLLDEPLASLDLPLRREILPFLLRVRDDFRVPMLVVSHDPIEVQALCDRLIVIREGKVVAEGAPRQVLTDPSSYPTAEDAGFENLLPCSLSSSSDEESVLSLGKGGPELIVPRCRARHPNALLVGIPARDIILATTRMTSLSARNFVASTITAIKRIGTRRLVMARVADGIPDFAVEVTAAACDSLGLAPEQSVYLVIKASACTVYGA